MGNKLVFLSAVLWLTALSSSHIQSCIVKDIQVQPNFQLSRMDGRRYELKWASFQFIPVDQRFHDYEHRHTINQTTGGMDVICVGRPTVNEDCFYFTGSLSVTDEPGKLLFTRPKSIFTDEGTRTTPYWIVATDYDNYAVTYGCLDVLADGTCESSNIESWVWSREPWVSTGVSNCGFDFEKNLYATGQIS